MLVKILRQRLDVAKGLGGWGGGGGGSTSTRVSNLSRDDTHTNNASHVKVVSLCCAILGHHMYCMDLDEVWHDYCQNLVRENLIIEG